ncbi:solanesyl diphosphate synthase [Chondrocystis sp. NIES-4102]|nr:solanesyl diphosphate synthase [Chondrocystis sp. NIES-4102]
MTSSTTSLLAPVENDLQILTDNLKQLISARHPILGAAAEHLFEAGGKRIRPAIVLLVSRATMPNHELTPRHRRLAEITEMIHTASLVHDDVVDEADLRRNVETVNSLFGDKIAVLAGDFLFAQSSWYLANLDNLQVVKLLSEVIRDFAEGEIIQSINRFDIDASIDSYLDKTYYKTASLMANSAKAAAILSDADSSVVENLYSYGRNLGLAFQIVDDILDFTGSAEVLGKPAGLDLASGKLTSPVFYAIKQEPHLEVLIERKFSDPEDLDKALELIRSTDGIEQARQLAKNLAHQAAQCITCLKPSDSKDALHDLTDYAVSRLY